MITSAVIGKVTLKRTPFLPPVLLPLIYAAEAGAPLEPVLTEICRKLGFDGFMFGMSVNPQLTHESQIYAFTTLPIEWVMRYDQMDYVEIDPRLLKTRDSRIPLLWDATTEGGKDARTDAFLEDAARHGVASGFAFEFNDTKYVRGLMALNSASLSIDNAMRSAVERGLGDILLLGAYFHEIFRLGVIAQGLPPPSRGAPLSPRQRQCLELAARGLTTEEIAMKLNIAARTAQFHFDSIRSKLGASNRQEAIAKAISEGVIAR